MEGSSAVKTHLAGDSLALWCWFDVVKMLGGGPACLCAKGQMGYDGFCGVTGDLC